MVFQATWRDMGYRRIGPRNPADADQQAMARMLGTAMEQHAEYEAIVEQNAVWVRDPLRKKGVTRHPAVRLQAVADITNYTNSEKYNFIREVQGTVYGEFDFGERVLKGKSSADLLKEFVEAPKTSGGAYALSLAFAKCPLNQLRDYLVSGFFPAFFGVFPKGRAILLQHNPLYERRFGTVRAGYTMQQYGRLDKVALDGFETMKEWQIQAPSIQLRMLLDLGAIAFFPTIQYITMVRIGITMVLVPGEDLQHHLGPFPTDWMSVYRSHWDFAREERSTGASGLSAAGVTASYGALQRYVQFPGLSVDEISAWVEWLVNRFNVLQFHQTDAAEFDDGGDIDFVTCLEHALSFDRIVRKGISASCSEEVLVRKSAAMEIADLIEELASYWSGKRVDRFKLLFHPKDGLALLNTALGSLPPAIKANLLGAAATVYDHLERAILESVFVAAKRTSTGGVLVRNNKLSAEREESGPDFVSNLIRCLRNTHHGYLTKADSKQLRPSRYLALSTGNVPNTFSFLGTLFALACVADPLTLIGWKFLPVDHFE